MPPLEDSFHVPRNDGLVPAKDWIVKNGGHVHKAFSPSSSRFDDQRAQFVPAKELEIDSAQSYTHHFLRALEIYHTTTKDKYSAVIDFGGVHTWDDVLREYEDAQRKYGNKTKGWKGAPRKVGRVVGDNASSINPYLKLLPSGDYTTVLTGGLLLIFTAAGRMSEKRHQILDSFGEVLAAIQQAEEYCETFAKDESLTEEAIELYVVILIAIMEMMQWLVEKGGWKQIKSLLQGPRYAISLDDKIKDVQKQSSSLRSRVEELTRDAILRTDNTTKETGSRVISLATTTDIIDSTTRETGSQVAKIGPIVDDIKTDTTASQLSLQHVEAEVAQIRKGVEAQNDFLSMLKEEYRKAAWNNKSLQEERRKLKLAQAQENRGMILKSSHLLELIAVDPVKCSDDLALMLRRGSTAEPSLQGRGQLLMRSPQFQAWISSGLSKCLLVDGNGQSASERTSAMTFLCALLAESLSGESAVAIHFFCGLHTERTKALSGPRGLLRSLLAQLVSLHDFSLSFVDSNEYRELQRFDIRRLCRLLERLVKELPQGFVLFCIIDGISLYEKPEWNEDTCLALGRISDLTRDPENQAVFKVLVTSPVASRYVSKEIPQEDHLRLSRNSGQGDGRPLTRRTMQSRRSAGSSTSLGGSQLGESPFEQDEDIDEGFVDGNFDESMI